MVALIPRKGQNMTNHDANTVYEEPIGGSTIETIEVDVANAASSGASSSAWLIDGFRRLALAGIGAVAMTFDEAEALVSKLVDRGELAQKDGQQILNEIQQKISSVRQTLPAPVERIEQRFEEILGRMNIPSKRDIDDLSARIAQLTARVEELKKK
jgi:poly(hydroxyalkanoate) granule-associated protein